jgi:aryl-alcohol dehydrogenase-like predicted oxidoreductase
MEYITLGKTQSSVSKISLGTWSYGGAATSGTQSVGWADQDDADSNKTLLKAHDLGINHWDTADVYGDGRSEKIIGNMWNDISRHEIFLATKVGWDMGPYNHWYNPTHMMTNMERSLNNLKTECVDLMYLHHCNFGKNGEYFDDTMEVLLKFQEDGKTKFIGLSDWSDEKIMRYIYKVNPDVVQPYRNVMDNNYESSGLKDYIDSNNVGVCFFSPIKHGLLTGKYKSPPKFKEGDYRRNVEAFNNQDIIDKLLENKSKLGSKFHNHSQPVMHGLIAPLLQDAPTGCVLLGQRNEEQAIKASELGQSISKEDAEWVKELYNF